jgi:3-deoxy-D-manno-octulosonic-acid transferase
VSDLAVEKCAAWRVKDLTELTAAIQSLMNNPKKQADMGEIGRDLCVSLQGATQKTVAIISDFLNPNSH